MESETASIDTGRRRFIAAAGFGAAATGLLGACGSDEGSPSARARLDGSASWDDVRAAFDLSPGTIHMSAMLISSHPRPVREAIERHRRALDRDPIVYLERNNRRLQNAARAAAGDYLGIGTGDIALTDSTTMGVGLVYNGLRLAPGDEILSTEQDYFVTLEALRQLSERSGAVVRQIPLYDRAEEASGDALVDRVVGAVTRRTRLLALTWVHSSTGLKLPAARIGEAVRRINAERDERDHLLFCLDGVHGFGVEDFALERLGCDFLMAGCHKWLFGPRGTGIIAAGRRGYAPLVPSIPSFLEQGGAWEVWLEGDDEPGPTTAARMTPGGFKPFEHQWAMTEAFDFHRGLGKARIESRTHELVGALKDGLRRIDGVTVQTPVTPDLSSGIVSFDIDGLSSEAVVRRLRQRDIIASVAPYAVSHARLTPSIRNTPDEIDAVLQAVHEIA